MMSWMASPVCPVIAPSSAAACATVTSARLSLSAIARVNVATFLGDTVMS